MTGYINSFEFSGHTYYYCDLQKVFEYHPSLKRLPNSLKIILESNIRNAKSKDEVESIIRVFVNRFHFEQIELFSTRVIMNDSTAVPLLVDFASIKETLEDEKKDKVNPKVLTDVIIEEQKIASASKSELKRVEQRLSFAKWASKNFNNLTVIPPNCENRYINLEYLSTMISSSKEDEKIFVFPEFIVGSDYNTSNINALGVLGFKRNSLKTSMAILGSSLVLNLPKVIGIEIKGSFAQGVSINDASLVLSNLLKEHNLENQIIEFYGDGLKHLMLEDRAVLSQTVSDASCLCGYFSVDDNTISFVEQTRGVDASLIKEYYEKQSLLLSSQTLDYDSKLIFDFSLVKAVVRGPKNNQDRTPLKEVPQKIDSFKKGNFVRDNDIVYALINSNQNLSSLVQASLLAKKACELGLSINKDIKKELLLSSSIKEQLEILELLPFIKQLGFEILNYDCKHREESELFERISLDIEKFNLNVSALISGNCSEIKTNSLIKSNWRMSPALVIAFCLNSNMNIDITTESLQADIYLADIWPSMVEVNEYLEKVDSRIFSKVYENVFEGDELWKELVVEESQEYPWDEMSTYLQKSSFYEVLQRDSIKIENAKIVALFNDKITTEEISPIGNIPPYSPAAVYLQDRGLRPDEFNCFKSRYANEELMLRGAFSNIELQNRMVLPKEGGYTKDFESSEILTIYEFASKMKSEDRDLVLFAGKNYGVGESITWAGKVTKLLGIKAVVAKSFDEKHREDLILMGVLPLEFIDDDIDSLNLKGDEYISIETKDVKKEDKVELIITKANEVKSVELLLRLDNDLEVEYYKKGGVFPYLLNHS